MNKNILLAATMLVSSTTFADTGDFYLQGEAVPLYRMDIHSPKNTYQSTLPFRISGGYGFAHINNWTLGGELGYLNWNSVKLKKPPFTSIKQRNGGDLLFVADYKLAQGLHLLGKGGLAGIKQDFREGDFYNKFSSTIHTLAPEVAGGLAYQLTDHLSVTTTVSHVFGRKASPYTRSTLISGTDLLVGLKVNF